MNMTALADLVGLAEPLDPANMRFTVKVAKSCRSCLFEGQRASVCKEASRVAVLAGYNDCDDMSVDGKTFIYVAVVEDKRQLDLLTI